MTERSTPKPAGYVRLFRNGNFALMWSSKLSSQLGDHLNLMALAALIFSLSGGEIRGFEFSKILLLASVPVLVFGPVAGVYADRHNRKFLMIGSDLVRAVLVGSIPFIARSMTPIYVIVFLVFTINRFYLSAKTAAIPQIVDDDELLQANALLNVAMMMSLVIGPWGGGLLVDRFGSDVGFWADAGTYVVSASLASFITLKSVADVVRERRARREAEERTGSPRGRLARAKRLGRQREEGGDEGPVAAAADLDVQAIRSAYGRLVDDLKGGMQQMRGRRMVVYATVSMSAVMFLAGLVLVVAPVFVRNVFGKGAADLGMLYSVGGIGMLLGSLIVGRYMADVPRRVIVSLSFLLAGVAVMVMAFADTIQMLGALVFATGFVVAPSMVACDTMMQESMQAESIGKAFGFREMVSKAAFGVAGILAGIIADAVGPREVLVGASVGCVAYSAVSIVLLADTSRFNALNAYPLMRAGSRLAALLPRSVTYPAASCLSFLGYVLLPRRRRTARRNAARVLGVSAESRDARRTAREMFRSYGLYWADFFALNGRLGENVSRFTTFEGLENLEEAVAEGKGVVFATAHLGSWDVGGTALASIESLASFSAIVEPVVTEKSEEEMKEMRRKRGLNVIPLGRPLKIGRALRRKEVVFFVADRTINGEGVEVEFFSRPAEVPKGPAYWSLKTGAPVVPGFCVRDGKRFICYVDPAVEFEASGDQDRDIRELSARMVAAFEKYIGRYPPQWCMLQQVWTPDEDEE